MPQEMKMFAKSLTETDIKKRLAIPVKILSSLPDFDGSQALTVSLVYGTRVWPIVCSVRKTGHKKPVFSGGWRNFVVCNDFHVGDKLTMYKVQDEADSFHYQVEVEKQPSPSVARSLNHEVDQTTCTSRTKISNFDNEKEQLPKAEVPIKQIGFDDHVIAKPTCSIFGNFSSKPPFKPEHETEMNLGICVGMRESPLHACYITKEERDIKPNLGLNVGGSVLAAYGSTSQAAGEEYTKSTERLSLDLVLGQPPSVYDGTVNLDLSLAQPIADTRLI